MDAEQLALIALILNPWNGVLGFCVWSGIQTLKSLVPSFKDGGQLHHTLRFICVGACTICYFIPGPWVDGDMTPGMKLILGVITGTVTTLLHGMISDARRFVLKLFSKKDPSVEDAAKDLDTLIASGKKLAGVTAAIGAGLSGVYGAWLKPEDTSKAKAAYEVTERGIEELSSDIVEFDENLDELTQAHNELDKQSAIEINLLKKRVEALEQNLKQRMLYKAPRVSVEEEELSMAAQVQLEDDEELIMEGDDGVFDQIKRTGKKLDLPAAKEIFK